MRIKISHKNVDEIAEQYGLNKAQKQAMGELLREENDDLWNQLLYEKNMEMGTSEY